ncbi:MAG TPA: hypothetical protein VFB90_02115 [Dehalococcoidia bacterium]|nr:hypothetical protein [Dehalococcoidia bacterium]
MQIDWHSTINDILAQKLACRRCGGLSDEVRIGYLRSPDAVPWAPLCEGCAKSDSCESRKLVVLCEECAQTVRLRGRKVNEQGLMASLIDECRRQLEETLDYIAEYWKDDLDIDPEEVDERLEDVDPELFQEEDAWRLYLEEQYIKCHQWFRRHTIPVPNPGWRSEYVEEVVALGYPTLLGE